MLCFFLRMSLVLSSGSISSAHLYHISYCVVREYHFVVASCYLAFLSCYVSGYCHSFPVIS